MIKFVKYKENSHMENKSRLKPLRSFLALNIPKQHFFFNIARILEDASITGSGYNLGPWEIFSPAIFLFNISQTPGLHCTHQSPYLPRVFMIIDYLRVGRFYCIKFKGCVHLIRNTKVTKKSPL